MKPIAPSETYRDDMKKAIAADIAYAKIRRADLEKHGQRVLDRLKNNARACAAIKAIVKNPGDGADLLGACVDAEILARTFNKRVAEERRTIKQMDDLEKHIGELQGFAAKVTRPADSMAAWFVVPDDEIALVREGLDQLAMWVRVRRKIVTDNLTRWGATRKSAPTNKVAAENAAIGWIADVVQDIAGKPLTQHATALAEAALDICNLSDERVREARRARQKLVR